MSEIATSTGGSSIFSNSHDPTTPTISPITMPATTTTTNEASALWSRNGMPSATPTAVRYATRAVASLRRLSPSRIVMTRRGAPRFRKTAVAAIASGGATMAPSANAAANPISGTAALTTTATMVAVNSTSPIASSRIGRVLALKSRYGVR